MDIKSEYYKIKNQQTAEAYDRIAVLCKKGRRVDYKVEASKRDISLSAFVVSCIDKELIESGYLE